MNDILDASYLGEIDDIRESIKDVAMTTGEDGVNIDLTDVGGGTVLLADLTAVPDAGDFLV